ncbi:MAG: uracil-DNA glycosylase [Candidatus Parcubacteria bacterium]|nr:MAG: uracil-DNA glycosylase [Candidatus Parcubacteria bacterium]
MKETAVRIHPSWKEVLREEFSKPYFRDLAAFVREQYLKGAAYPHPKNLFRAFDLTPFDAVRVVIVGQDPYPNPGQANGLAFAVNPEVPEPPSLKNIFREIEAEFGRSPHSGRDLLHWARQGVLLLNAVLTVRPGEPASHRGKGWEEFTNAVLQALNEKKDHLVFLLWGADARKKRQFIDANRHLVLEAAHPSPLSAERGFFGCGHFKRANEYLAAHGKEPIDW